MRALYICANGNIIGGVESNLIKIIEHAQLCQIEPVGVLVPNYGNFTDALQKTHIPIGIISYHRWQITRPWRYLQTFWQLLKWTRDLQPDVIHLTNQWLVEYAAQLKRIQSKPVVCDLVNIETMEFIKRNSKFFARIDRIVAKSAAVKENLLAICPELSKRTQVIYNGICIKDYTVGSDSENPRKAFELPENANLVGFIGRLVPEKGVEDLLDAWHLVIQKHPDSFLLIVGEDDKQGIYCSSIREKAREIGIGDSVIFTGFRSDIPAIMQDIDVFVLPTHQEAFGIVLIEAMAAGCKVIATDVGGIPEIVAHGINGLLVPPKRPDKLAAAILQFLSMEDSIAQEMLNAARRTVQERFSIDIQIEQLRNLYMELYP
ncbi:MAG: glycosyltransferase family 4 protein [Chloroflexota bacterium]